MENFYLIIIVILFALAISDLVVGVANDAVNFLNSAVGSKAAPKWVIFLVASLGVLVGAVFSSGMMEIARKGIFNPDMFVFSEIMVIFLAVMITDVILLDMFNVFGLPTSTTVSIVFELLGASVAVALVKITRMGQSIGHLSEYMNSEKALAIISGILVSVVIAFSVGTIIQYISRLIFSFRVNKPLKYFGSVFGGASIAAMTYFMIIKGAKGAAFMTEDNIRFMDENITQIIFYSFLGWTALLQILYWIFKIDIPKFIVLVGTFGLAMAFAGNDLVNFIGVPLAGFQSFMAWAGAGHPSPDGFTMEMLKGKMQTPEYMLIISGIVMIITLITSRKAHNVIATSVDLSRQTEGDERFGSSMLSRVIVRSTINVNKRVRSVLPDRFLNAIDSRFQPHDDGSLAFVKPEDRPAFDKIRASINLIVSGILISLGTSLKLPLSTTYVTFMVAMGTSLADRAWGRESAVYRISGVFAVVGGWFMTALVAFIISAFIAFMISIGGNVMIFVFIAIAVFLIIRTHILFKRRTIKIEEDDEDLVPEVDQGRKLLEKSAKQVVNAINASNTIFASAIESFLKEDRPGVREALEAAEEFNRKSKKYKTRLYAVIQKLQQDSAETGHCYVQVVDYQREISHSLNYLVMPIREHLENNHKPFIDSQIKEMRELIKLIDDFFKHASTMVLEKRIENIEELFQKRDKIVERLVSMEKQQIKRIKNKDVNTKNAVIFFNILTETKNLLNHTINLMKSQRDFAVQTRKLQ
jgi:phosphate/sulfate permease